MRRMVLTVALLAAGLASPAQAASAANCEVLASAMVGFMPAMTTLLKSLQAINLRPAFGEFAGPERAALEAMADRQDVLAPALEAYLSAAEDVEYLMRKCSR